MRGFTLIELLIVISIMLIVAVVAIPIYGKLQVSTQLNENTTHVIQMTRNARQQSVVRYNASPHGVFFEINAEDKDRVILFQGASYATRDSQYDREFVLEKAITLSTTLDQTQVTFSQGLGKAIHTGTVTLTHDVAGARSVSVNAFGKVEED